MSEAIAPSAKVNLKAFDGYVISISTWQYLVFRVFMVGVSFVSSFFYAYKAAFQSASSDVGYQVIFEIIFVVNMVAIFLTEVH